jgi:hypothetical protein
MKKKKSQIYYSPMAKDDMDKWDDKKTAVMSQDEITRTLEYMDWFRAAHDAKSDRGFFELWQNLDDAWEGDLNKKVFEDDPASNTNIIHPTVEGQVALICGDEVAIEPRPITPSELAYVKPTKNLLEFVKDNNDYIVKRDMFFRRYEKYGTGIFMVKFDKNWGDGFGLPVIRACSPFYVYPDPNITDIYAIQEGRFIIETITKSISWAEREFGYDKSRCIIPNYEPNLQCQYFGEGNGNGEVSGQYYIHMLIWEKYMEAIKPPNAKPKIKLRLSQMSGDGTLLSDSVEDKFTFPNSDFPYFMAPCYHREGTIWGKSNAELCMDLQTQINDYDDQIRMNARLTGNPQKWVDITAVTDPDKLTNESGLIIPTQGNGSLAVGYLRAADMPQYIIQRRDRIMDSDRFQVSRFYEQMVGGRTKGVDTATQALQMQNSGMVGIDHQKSLVGKLESNMYEYILEMCIHYYNGEKMFTITGEKDQFMAFNTSSLNKIPKMIAPTESFISDFRIRNKDKKVTQFMADTDKEGKVKTKKAKFRIDIKVGAGTPKNKAFTYTMMKEAFAMETITLAEWRKYLSTIMELPIEEEMPQDLPNPAEQKTNPSMGLNKTTNPTGVQKPSPNNPGMNSKDQVTLDNGGGM